jgi:hypothetical protein
LSDSSAIRIARELLYTDCRNGKLYKNLGDILNDVAIIGFIRDHIPKSEFILLNLMGMSSFDKRNYLELFTEDDLALMARSVPLQKTIDVAYLLVKLSPMEMETESLYLISTELSKRFFEIQPNMQG